MADQKFDVVIVGAGPGGVACALSLHEAGLKVALLDKAQFPRDKICGDALSADVLNQLAKLPGDGVSLIHKNTPHAPSYGVRFFAPSHQRLDIAFSKQDSDTPPGYIVKRTDFDHALLTQARAFQHIKILEGYQASQVTTHATGAEVVTNQGVLTCQAIIGADGAHSVVTKQLGNFQVEKHHYCAGLRAYYENVTGFHEDNFIELHFYKDLLPGYFWIFPLPNNCANVGLGMLSSAVSKKRVNLKAALQKIITTHPNVAPRFAHAQPIDEVRGFGLPIGSKKRPISGERFMLIGDAASLIDPFTGEGIGNAIRSGRIAAEHLKQCFKSQDFSAKAMRGYDREVYRKMWSELKTSRAMQQLLNYPWLFDFVVRKANKNEAVRKLLTAALDDVAIKQELTKPSFYLKLALG